MCCQSLSQNLFFPAQGILWGRTYCIESDLCFYTLCVYVCTWCKGFLHVQCNDVYILSYMFTCWMNDLQCTPSTVTTPKVSAREEQFSSLRWIETLPVDGFSYWRRMWTQHGIAKTRCGMSQPLRLTLGVIKIPQFLLALGHQCDVTASLFPCAFVSN